MLGAIAALAVLGAHPHLPTLWRRPDERTHWRRTNGWDLKIHYDRFTGAQACTLFRRNVVYSGGVVTFRFDHWVDTANAQFRLGAGPLRSAGSVAVEAAGLGARFEGPNLRNPSNGEVHIPGDVVGGAQSVSIKPNPHMSHRTFDLRGLSHAVEVAKGQHCDDLGGPDSLDRAQS